MRALWTGWRFTWLLPVALRLVAIAVCRQQAFWSVSDDDFARVLIAQDFARIPHWDPSGSSWLPFPFWLHGSLLQLFGNELSVARHVSELLSVLSVAGVFWAARLAGLPRRGALLTASACAILPHAVWLSTATIPDGYVAVLCFVGLATLTQSRLQLRALGALAVAAAAASRYEAWPVAATFFAFAALAPEGIEQQCSPLGARSRWPHWLVGGVALTPSLLWLLHGVLHHASALFFLKRVADYRHALGQSSGSLLHVLTTYFSALFESEPELSAALLAAALGRLWSARPVVSSSAPALGWLRRYLHPFVVGSLALIVFLIVGDLRDGAPTHHPERPLLLVWLCFTWFIAKTVTEAPFIAQPRRNFGVLGALVLVGLTLRSQVLPPTTFINREAEVRVGSALRARLARLPAQTLARQDNTALPAQTLARQDNTALPAQMILIDTGDYGTLAVQASLNRPQQTLSLNAADPRQVTPAIWQDQQRLVEYLHAHHIGWIVTRAEHETQLWGLGIAVQSDGDLRWGPLPEVGQERANEP